ncbi:outer membrane beta-barrel protein [Phocaeicola sp.]|uniref:OmpP1/FadL family transporter n=1 Tax=Phocaeicola sp. TaxID=2773926 RepID=UPI00283ECC26|nr:outer membrane beta-barrel protein [Phocaeicola sp.]MDR3795696.1 outer membrane beta-barrel protein [Phocaeicola sp.]
MKKILFLSAATLCLTFPAFAGDYLTNTNQHAAFLRMVARGASIDVDGVYSNPAGLSFLPHEGFYLSLTGQSAYQTREINATFPLFQQADGVGTNRQYKGTASAPLIPSFQGLYKKDKWVISASFAITGGGGKASFSNGLPMFDALAMGMISQQTGGKVTPQMYDINTAMDGKQYIYGLQLGLSYKINDWLSVFAGGRMNYVSSGYEGYLKAHLKENLGDTQLANLELNCDQSGWGLTPILGIDAKLGRWNLAAKYEFKTNLNIENKTNVLEVPAGTPEAIMKPYADGEQTPSDIPAFLSVAAGYEILPNLRASVEYHFFDDKHAGMLNDRQKTLKHGTHEYLAGLEWNITKRLTVSGGYQRTNYGLSDEFQTDTSFYCDSYSLGFGARVNLTQAWSIDVAYFWTHYDKYTKEVASYNGTGLSGTDIYYRTNKVFGLSLNYKF